MAFIKFKPIASQFRFFAIVNADEIDAETLEFVNKDEKIIMAFRSKRDIGIFTDKRIVLIDKKGIRGFRKSIYAIKYESISSYVLNIHNLDSNLEIIINSSHKLMIDFLKPIPLSNVYVIYKYITNYIIKS